MKINWLIKMLIGFIAVFVMTFTVMTAFIRTADAHDIGWRWRRPEIAIVVENRTTNYGSSIASARADYNNNTNLNLGSCTDNGNCGNLIFLQANYGVTGWDGMANPYSNATICVNANGTPNGFCNKTNHRVDFGYVYFNNYYGSYWIPAYGTRHEMGHIFGLKHTDDCQEVNSIMKEGTCRPQVPSSLRAHDRNDINSYYP